jgi:predicted AAA-ATPase
MKLLPTDISSFELLIKNNCVYVDKTEYIYLLFGTGLRYYFLSRPRRFGKTLLISTLEHLFLGNRELFKGLWIDSSDWQWKKHPIVHLDFTAIAHDSAERLDQGIRDKLDLISEPSPKQKRSIMQRLSISSNVGTMAINFLKKLKLQKSTTHFKQKKLDAFCAILQALFAKIPYDLHNASSLLS